MRIRPREKVCVPFFAGDGVDLHEAIAHRVPNGNVPVRMKLSSMRAEAMDLAPKTVEAQ
jgi:hypothetical protein